MKVLITVPRRDKGGVANYYNVLGKYLEDEAIFASRGSKPKDTCRYEKMLRLLKDYLKFIYILLFQCRKVVLINTSLGEKSLKRDFVYIYLCKLFSKKVVLFIHGWNKEYEKKFFSNQDFKKKIFSRCDNYIVLSSEFKRKLKNYGVNAPIYLLTTLVDDRFASFGKVKSNQGNKDDMKILFLARIKKQKGVMEALQAYEILRENGLSVSFSLAGDGSFLPYIRDYVKKNNLSEIDFLGYVSGRDKIEVFNNSDIYLLPSYHEGMPTTVLESMAMGLPVVTTRVGGIPDFFEEGQMGLLLENRKPVHIAEKVEYLLERPELMNKMSKYNYDYAKEHFYASKVAKRLENIIDDVVEEKV